MAWYRQSPSPGLLMSRECVKSSTVALASAAVVTLEGRVVRVFSSAESDGRITDAGK